MDPNSALIRGDTLFLRDEEYMDSDQCRDKFIKKDQQLFQQVQDEHRVQLELSDVPIKIQLSRPPAPSPVNA